MAAASISSGGMQADTSTTTSSTANNNIYVASALSDKSIVLYDIQTNSIIDRIYNAHDGPISEIQFFNSPSSSTAASTTTTASMMSLISAGHDGYVKTWDFRCRNNYYNYNSSGMTSNSSGGTTTTATGTFKLGQRNEKALCVSVGYDGSLAAVGTDQAHISFFDLRYCQSSSSVSGSNSSSTALLGNYIDAHTDDVTCVKFQTIPSTSSSSSGCNSNSSSNTTTTVLATASEDGLINIYNPSASTEETALLTVINVNCPIREITFFGPNYQGLAVLTGNESMVCYHWDSGQLICNVGNGIGIGGIGNSGNSSNGMGGLRKVLSDTIRLSSSNRSNNGKTTNINMSSSSAIGGNEMMMMDDDDNDKTCCDDDTENTIDYLISCQWTTLPSSSSCQPALHLLAGNTNGNAYIFQIDTNSITPLVHLTGGHRGCIRDFVWIDNDSDYNAIVGKRRLITGGEDARLCEWDLFSSSSSSLLGVGTNTTMSTTNKNSSGGRARSSKYSISENSNAADIRKEKKKTKTKLGYPY
jgi:hypothetical protein